MRCKSAGKPGRLMLVLMCIWVAGLATFGLFVENIVGWFLFFSPGWANGWPSGWSFQTVLSVGMTGYILLQLMTAAVGVGAIVGLICIFLRVEEEYESLVYRRWLWFAVVFLCLGACIFWRVYVWVWEAFPDGYIIT
ncbi:MAG: hypothetical protein ACHRXM_15280 [Isosphaerales bacterium]